MLIVRNSGGIAQTNCYLVADEEAHVAVLFDAPDHTAGALVDECAKRGWDLIGLWLTHGHFDHIADHKVVTDRFPKARVLIHPLDEPKLKDPTSRIFPLPFTIPPRSADGLLSDGQILDLGSLKVHVIHTPGHAPGHVMFYIPQKQTVIGGDLIIGGSIGRTDLPDSDHAQLVQSLKRAMQLPDETYLLPGHGEPSRIGDERKNNPYVIDALAE